MAYYDNYYPEYRQIETPLLIPVARSGQSGDTRNRRMLFILLLVLAVASLLVKFAPRHVASASDSGQAPAEVDTHGVATASTSDSDPSAGSAAAAIGASGQLSPVFTREVLHWAPQIETWAGLFGLDPNLVAIIMQIESCGDQGALSHAGAQGLFQVMPFHFGAGENALDPETNARRGLNYFVERLNQTGGDVGRAFAGYNGGQRAAASSWETWPAETQRYYKWSTGIYNDIQAGLTESPTLQSWLQAGGASLCRQAAGRIGLQ